MAPLLKPDPSHRNATRTPRLVLGVDVFTAGQIARLFGVAARTADKWADAGRIDHHREGTHRRFTRAAVLRFAASEGLPLPPAFCAGPAAVYAGTDWPEPFMTLSAVAVGAKAAAGGVTAAVIGCGQTRATAFEVAGELMAVAPWVRLALLAHDDFDWGSGERWPFHRLYPSHARHEAAAWALSVARQEVPRCRNSKP